MKIYDYILCSGSGNRFLLFDTLRSDLSGLNIAAFAAEELHRFGVDGLLLLTRDGRGRFGMRMFNTDGSEAEMCGNGIRCVARLARERYPEATGERFAVTSGGREYRITCEEPIFGALPTFGAEIPLSLHGDDFPPSLPAEEFVGQPVPELDEGPAFTFLQPGNPHIVALVAPDSAWLFGSDGRLDTRRLAELGERANRMRGVFPRGINVSLFCRLDEGRIFAATYELLLRHGDDLVRHGRRIARTRRLRHDCRGLEPRRPRALPAAPHAAGNRHPPDGRRLFRNGGTAPARRERVHRHGRRFAPRPSLRPAAADRRDPARTTRKIRFNNS